MIRRNRKTFSSHKFKSMINYFFFNDTATTEIYTLSLHDALPISNDGCWRIAVKPLPLYLALPTRHRRQTRRRRQTDRKSTRLNSSHSQISYAVFCLKKKTMTYLVANTVYYATPHVCSEPLASTVL